MWWTCDYCNTVFWTNKHHPHGHALACDNCWTLSCKDYACYACKREAKNTMALLERLGPKENDER